MLRMPRERHREIRGYQCLSFIHNAAGYLNGLQLALTTEVVEPGHEHAEFFCRKSLRLRQRHEMRVRCHACLDGLRAGQLHWRNSKAVSWILQAGRRWL